MWIDSHCHLEHFARKGELPAVLERARQAGVEAMVTIGTGLKDWALYRDLVQAHPETLYWTAGLHPNCVGEDWEEQVAALPSFFAEAPHPVALGEIGLDYFRLSSYPDEAAEQKSRQQWAFQMQLELAYQFDCPVVIHARAAVAECVAAIDASGVNWDRVVFHCFTEGPESLAPILERGGRASFTGILTYTNKNVEPVQAALISQGPEQLMVETDCPYLSPEPHRTATNEPAYLVHTGHKAAALLGLSVEEMADLTTATTRKFFGLNR